MLRYFNLEGCYAFLAFLVVLLRFSGKPQEKSQLPFPFKPHDSEQKLQNFQNSKYRNTELKLQNSNYRTTELPELKLQNYRTQTTELPELKLQNYRTTELQNFQNYRTTELQNFPELSRTFQNYRIL